MDLFNYIKETEGLENSLNFAIKHGLLPDKKSRTCIKCGREGGLRWTKNSRVVNIPFMFVCAQRECRSTISLGRNTLFDRLSFPLSHALRLIYFWLMKISIKESAAQFQLSEGTVSEWFQFFREVCAFVIINYTEAIGGPGHIVEICEFHLQTKEESYDVWIIAGVDRNTGLNFAIHVEELDCEILWPVIKNYILPGSVVVTSRFREFMKRESISESPNLIFVNPNKFPRTEENHSLDDMWIALKLYVENEIPSSAEEIVCKEIYAYQFLYFNRDGYADKPASELILPFIHDVRLVYPGFEKEKDIEYKTQKYPKSALQK